MESAAKDLTAARGDGMFRTSGPILKTVGAAICAAMAATALGYEALAGSTFTPVHVLWFLAGLLYTQLFEYWVHEVPMHRGLPLLGDVRRNHRQHHRMFHGEGFRTRSPANLENIPGRWWIFPLLFAVHAAAAASLLKAAAAGAFLAGCLVHYIGFELTHWFTHVEDNRFDRLLARMPLLGPVRSRQIEHHRIHHETPVVGFNFNPPYLGDRIAGRMPRPLEAEMPAPPVPVAIRAPAPVAALPGRLWTRSTVLYGAAAIVVGVAALGLVLAHGKLVQVKAVSTSEI